MKGRRPTDFALAKTVGVQIWRGRLKKNLSTAELAKKAGLSGIISHFESAKRLPDLQTLIKIADALECSMDFLCGR